jgi:hypothetical protein
MGRPKKDGVSGAYVDKPELRIVASTVSCCQENPLGNQNSGAAPKGHQVLIVEQDEPDVRVAVLLIYNPEHHGAGCAGQERCGDEERRNQKKNYGLSHVIRCVCYVIKVLTVYAFISLTQQDPGSPFKSDLIIE